MRPTEALWWETLWDFADRFGWTPDQVGKLQLDEHAYFVDYFRQIRKAEQAEQAKLAQAERDARG